MCWGLTGHEVRLPGQEGGGSRVGCGRLYFGRDWMRTTLIDCGLTDVRVADQEIHSYGNTPFRFNAWGFTP